MGLTWGKWEIASWKHSLLITHKSTCLNAFLFVFASYKIQEYLKWNNCEIQDLSLSSYFLGEEYEII